jgi:tetratricopeptide (TPR) repeat protein
MPSIVRALTLWGEGKRTPDVLRGAFSVSPEQYDARYRSWERRKLARYDGQFMFDEHAPPLAEAKAKAEVASGDAKAQARYALALLREHKSEEAKAVLEAALKKTPLEPSALYLAARLALAHKDVAGAGSRLDALRLAHADGYSVELARAEVAEAKGDKAGRRRALEAAAGFDPTQTEPLRGLFSIAEDEKRGADAIDLLRRWADLDQHDRGVWRRLLDRLVEAKRWDEAVAAGESAVFVDVENAAVHLGYGRALAARGQHAKAAFEFETATLCPAPPKVRATASALLSQERLVLNDPAGARAAREEALRLDPANAEAKAAAVSQQGQAAPR